MCDVENINLAISSIPIYEDAAHCFEGSIRGIKPGQVSNGAILSFYATKNITCGDGGALLSNPDGAESETNFSGKVGGSISAAEKIDVYGEFSMVADDTNSYGTKLGLKYKF